MGTKAKRGLCEIEVGDYITRYKHPNWLHRVIDLVGFAIVTREIGTGLRYEVSGATGQDKISGDFFRPATQDEIDRFVLPISYEGWEWLYEGRNQSEDGSF